MKQEWDVIKKNFSEKNKVLLGTKMRTDVFQ